MASKTRLAAMVGGFVVVFLSLRRVGRRSGATSVEVNGALPGDDVVSQPQWESTRATTINVPPAQVWPWIVQMGFPAYRAGWYTPYWLDRAQWGIRNRSSDEIRDDLQSLRVGDLVPDSLDWSAYFTVETLEPERALVLHSTRHLLPPMRAIDFTWAFVLQAVGVDKDAVRDTGASAVCAALVMAGSRRPLPRRRPRQLEQHPASREDAKRASRATSGGTRILYGRRIAR